MDNERLETFWNGVHLEEEEEEEEKEEEKEEKGKLRNW